METNTIKQQIIDVLDDLTPHQQERLLAVANDLRRSKLPPGTPGEVLLAKREEFVDDIEAVRELMQIIEEEKANERIDWDGWQ